MAVDTHIHFWNLDNKPDFPTKDLTPIYRDFTPADYLNEMKSSDIRYGLHVQVSHELEENLRVSSMVNENVFLAGYVGWVDLEGEDCLTTLNQLKQKPIFRGIRHQLHEKPYTGWLEQKQVLNGLAALAQHDLTFDGIIKTEHLSEFAKTAKQIPKLKIILNHCGSPDTKSASSIQKWHKDISLLAQYPNISIKLSGMAENVGSLDSSSLEPYFSHCLREFGAQRCLFGSNWPVCRLAHPEESRLDKLIQLLEPSLKDLSTEERRMVMSDNAVRVYDLKPRPY